MSSPPWPLAQPHRRPTRPTSRIQPTCSPPPPARPSTAQTRPSPAPTRALPSVHAGPTPPPLRPTLEWGAPAPNAEPPLPRTCPLAPGRLDVRNPTPHRPPRVPTITSTARTPRPPRTLARRRYKQEPPCDPPSLLLGSRHRLALMRFVELHHHRRVSSIRAAPSPTSPVTTTLTPSQSAMPRRHSAAEPPRCPTTPSTAAPSFVRVLATLTRSPRRLATTTRQPR